MPPSSDQSDDSAYRMDKLRRTIGLFLGPVLFFFVLLVPSELDPRAHRLAAVFTLVVVLWITEAIPLAATALLGPARGVIEHAELVAGVLLFGVPFYDLPEDPLGLRAVALQVRRKHRLDHQAVTLGGVLLEPVGVLECRDGLSPRVCLHAESEPRDGERGVQLDGVAIPAARVSPLRPTLLRNRQPRRPRSL